MFEPVQTRDMVDVRTLGASTLRVDESFPKDFVLGASQCKVVPDSTIDELDNKFDEEKRREFRQQYPRSDYSDSDDEE